VLAFQAGVLYEEGVDVVLAHRGRQVTTADVVLINELVSANPQASRRALSKKLCEMWGWRQSNGSLRDMVCRSLMLELHRAGHIELPPVRMTPPNPLARRKRPAPVEVDQSPLHGTLRWLGPLEIRPVRRTDEEPLLNGLIEMHHYLGYTQPVGEQLKHMVFAGDRPVACFTWSSAPRHLAPRDRFIGWAPHVRRAHIHLIAYNSRFLILPWVEVPHLASHLLGRLTRRLSSDWQDLYDHPVHFVETFVHTERFKGTCYRAANWVTLGSTTGRGKGDQTHRPNRPIKDVLGLPLSKRFREKLGAI
jgi:Druantia protein DruA